MALGPLVDAQLLQAQRRELVVVDCRFVLGQPGAGERAYHAGHIPGAAYLDLDCDLASPPGAGGRHPLPAATAFEAAARRAGISSGSAVVAYDEAGEGGAARLWWLLRHFGHDDVALLDGGLRGWRDGSGALEADAPAVPAGNFRARPRGSDTASRAEVERATATDDAEHPLSEAAQPHDARSAPILLDARAPERYRGEVEPIDPIAGHIPGARNLPFATLAPGGRFLAPEELRARFAQAGVDADDEAIAYCGSGVSATVLVLAAAVAGLRPPRLYPGSWSEWSGAGLPAARHDSARSTDSRSSGPGGRRER